MPTTAATHATQILSVSTALVASGGIATLSLFDIPLLKSQPASRSLPMTRWLFSRGSHIFPTAAAISSSGFAYLAYSALPIGQRTISAFLQHATRGTVGLYAAAAALTISIAPWTMIAMIPTNFTLIKLNEQLGGTRSAKSAQYRQKIAEDPNKMPGGWDRSAEDSVDGKDDVSQWLDFSPPQERTRKDSSKKQDEEVRELLEKFKFLNWARAVLMGVGGVVGLSAALA
ncbi:hypothetical protein BKA63DRAFT_527195 [Paraphoma chrysanthemicola]|nr:hypothetical protein BKA63DRAFT_527195 [Paraphoma chrysanthemicola]